MMSEQTSFSALRWLGARPSTLQRLLDRLDLAVDFAPLVAELQAALPVSTGKGRMPWPLETLCRISALALVFGWNGRQAEDALLDLPAVCSFCRLNDNGRRPPDAETVSGFRRKLQAAGLGAVIEDHLQAELKRWGLRLAPGSTVEPRLTGGDGCA
ncbi:MAG: transposase [Candidatus Accumulibacter sp.]|jgi:IS5 family transposase|nr:transposase [Candidatus Accumulibacter necessarius]